MSHALASPGLRVRRAKAGPRQSRGPVRESTSRGADPTLHISLKIVTSVAARGPATLSHSRDQKATSRPASSIAPPRSARRNDSLIKDLGSSHNLRLSKAPPEDATETLFRNRNPLDTMAPEERLSKSLFHHQNQYSNSHLTHVCDSFFRRHNAVTKCPGTAVPTTLKGCKFTHFCLDKGLPNGG